MRYGITYLLVISVILVSMFAPLLSTSASNTVTLYDKTRRAIPGNLPWYPIIVIGDNRPADVNAIDPPDVFYQAVNEAENAFPLAVIGLGDHVGLGTPEQYEKLYEILNKTRLENLWFTPGNHDVSYSGISYWLQYIGPDTLIIDDIPGWRIGLVDSEADIATWENQLKAVYNGTGSRQLILAFHRPLYPGVNHNLRPGYDKVLLNYMNSYGWPRIALQAHFHAWVKYLYNGTDFLIVGSAGAPLYSCSDVSTPGAECLQVYHYLVMILYPNGTYTYTPILLGENSGAIRVIPLNSTAYLVANSKIDVYGRPVEYPVRLKFTIQGGELYVVARIPASSGVVFSIDPSSGRLRVSQDLDYYVYIVTGGGEPVVVTNASRELDLSQYIGGSISVEAPSEVVKAVTVTSTAVAFVTRTITSTSTLATTITLTTTETTQLPPVTQYITVNNTVSVTITATTTMTETRYETTPVVSTTTITETVSGMEGGYLAVLVALGAVALAELAVIVSRRKTGRS